MTGSQCDRVLAVLADGNVHTITEIHERAGTMRLNSRISELRARGHTIVCGRSYHRDAKGRPVRTYWYRLADSLPEPPAPPSPGGSGSEAGPCAANTRAAPALWTSGASTSPKQPTPQERGSA